MCFLLAIFNYPPTRPKTKRELLQKKTPKETKGCPPLYLLLTSIIFVPICCMDQIEKQIAMNHSMKTQPILKLLPIKSYKDDQSKLQANHKFYLVQNLFLQSLCHLSNLNKSVSRLFEAKVLVICHSLILLQYF